MKTIDSTKVLTEIDELPCIIEALKAKIESNNKKVQTSYKKLKEIVPFIRTNNLENGTLKHPSKDVTISAAEFYMKVKFALAHFNKENLFLSLSLKKYQVILEYNK